MYSFFHLQPGPALGLECWGMPAEMQCVILEALSLSDSDTSES